MDYMGMDLWEMSVSGAVFILVIVLARAVFIYRLPKKTFYVLWMAALLRLLVPVSMPFRLSVYSLFPESLIEEAKAVGREAPDGGQYFDGEGADRGLSDPGQFFTASGGMGQGPADSGDSTYKDAPGRQTVVYAWKLLWAGGCMICLCIFAALYVICGRRFAESLPVEHKNAAKWLGEHPIRRQIQIRQSARIQTPLTYGLFRPVILMPRRTDWDNERNLAYILAHEFIHIRRFDMLTKILLTAAVSVHWFNPFVWLMYILFNRDLELSCDEEVFSMVSGASRKEYADILIHMEEIKCIHGPLCSSFNKNAVEERMIAIMKMKKVTVLTGIAAAALVIGISGAFATSAAASGREQRAGSVSESAVQMDGSQNKSSAVEDRDGEESRTDVYADSKGAVSGEDVYENELGKEMEQEQTSVRAGSRNSMEQGAVSEENGGGFRTRAEECKIYEDAKFADYEKYGLSYDKETGYLMYKGKKVGYFKDEWSEQTYTRFIEDAGEIGIIVTRDKEYKITGLEEAAIPYVVQEQDPLVHAYAFSQEEPFDASYAVDGAKETGHNICSVPAKYQTYGITSDDKTGIWMYQGREAAVLYDTCGFLFTSEVTDEKNAVYLHIISDAEGNIKELKEVTKERMQKLIQEMYRSELS